MAKYYAYSPIHHDGGVVQFGEEVTQKGIGVTDEEWAVFLQDNVVGETKPPADLKSTESMTEYYKRKMREKVAAVEGGDFSEFDTAADEEPIGKTEAKEVRNS